MAVLLAFTGLVYIATGEARDREAGIFVALLGVVCLLAVAGQSVLALRRKKTRAYPPGEDRTRPDEAQAWERASSPARCAA
jgi:hypothetical protein